ncbi:hypothetical protein Bca4012_069860 [Brassica carinata]|uniref:BnaC05g04230D protein n=1 Tax=Brassica napus TaxID=3708 RepID=A0A078F6R7_BRANA|nr:BnaC05g04230D [Brassica napus]
MKLLYHLCSIYFKSLLLSSVFQTIIQLHALLGNSLLFVYPKTKPHLATRLSEKVLGLKLQQGLLENQSFFTTKAKHHHGFTHKTWTSKQTKGNADQQQQQLESLTSLASFSDTKDLSIRIQTRMNTTIFEATQMSEGIEEGFTGILLDSDTLGRSFCAEKTKQPARVVGMRATTTYEDNKNYLDNIFIFVDPCRPILSQFSRSRRDGERERKYTWRKKEKRVTSKIR